jgi:hypothetical protein
MGTVIDLCESRVSGIATEGRKARIFFSHACVRKSRGRPGQDPGTAWSQSAELIMQDANVPRVLPELPNAINAGALETGGVRYEMVPLPFTRRGEVVLDLTFTDGSVLHVTGHNPTIALLGPAVFLESTS